MISGQNPPSGVGARNTIEAAAKHFNIDLEKAGPDKKEGVGFASVMQGVNYHFGHEDSSEVRVEGR